MHKAGKGGAQCALTGRCFLNGNPPHHTQLRPLKVRSRTTTATLVKVPHRTAVLMKLPQKSDHHALESSSCPFGQLCRLAGRAGVGALDHKQLCPANAHLLTTTATRFMVFPTEKVTGLTPWFSTM